ncbi:MAG: F-type H+-transporting ATPase subunit alpha [Microgenomates group bacterium Gr01-1014_16]|nr:MAG: F-type H+-transporting ATPase subunit alpha [Microgenomates group bacterium Gr01-1014_16]
MNRFEQSLKKTKEVGYVQEVVLSIARVEGLPGVRLGEVVVGESGGEGQVASIGKETVEVLWFSRGGLRVGMKMARTGEALTVAVDEMVLGQSLDGLGRWMTGDESRARFRYKVDVVPPGLRSRARVARSLMSGVSLVDLLVPIGRGQRELIMGDRKTGKSQIVWQTILTQAKEGTICVYAAIGLKKLEIKKLEEKAESEGVKDRMVVVAAASQQAPGEIFMTPYTAMTVAEYFRDCGRDVLLILDDMSTHARFYRELSLLARKFPGRDSYPGDIFHVHSKLLERAGNFKVGNREASITALPIIETVQGDMTGYIQTNLMSMTDGHIYFDADAFFTGRRPAIDPFVSVTRVGYQTRNALHRSVNRELMAVLSAYEKTQGYLRFGVELGEASRQILVLGEKVWQFFDQPHISSIDGDLQLVMVAMIWAGLWNGRGVGRYVEWWQKTPGAKELVTEAARSETFSALVAKVREKSDLMVIKEAG